MPPPAPQPVAASVNSNWNGKALILKDGQNVNMPQTPNGSMFFTYLNKSTKNSQGKLTLSSGGSRPQELIAPQQRTTPCWQHQNWQGNNLSVTNVTGVSGVPIEIQAVGPGMPGTKPATIVTGQEMAMKPGDTAQVKLEPKWWNFTFRSPGYTATFAVIGGPPDDKGSNGYTFTVNAAQNNFPSNMDDIPPPGDYATTSNLFHFLVNWGDAVVFFACMSGVSTGENYIKVF